MAHETATIWALSRVIVVSGAGCAGRLTFDCWLSSSRDDPLVNEYMARGGDTGGQVTTSVARETFLCCKGNSIYCYSCLACILYPCLHVCIESNCYGGESHRYSTLVLYRVLVRIRVSIERFFRNKIGEAGSAFGTTDSNAYPDSLFIWQTAVLQLCFLRRIGPPFQDTEVNLVASEQRRIDQCAWLGARSSHGRG